MQVTQWGVVRLCTDGENGGCIISQTNDVGDLPPICFYSCKFTPGESNYPIYDKELLAVVEAFRQWRVYPEGAVVLVKVYMREDEGR